MDGSSSFPTALRTAAQARRLVPFVGAGVSMAVRRDDNQPAFPSWATLLKRAADQSNMVFLSLTMLMDELRAFLPDPSRKSNEFIAVDSTFRVWFRKTKNGHVRVECDKVLLTEMRSGELCRALLADIDAFWSKYRSRLAPDDAARYDLDNALADFKRFVAKLPEEGAR